MKNNKLLELIDLQSKMINENAKQIKRLYLYDIAITIILIIVLYVVTIIWWLWQRKRGVREDNEKRWKWNKYKY